jgi:hypothetical protein
MTTLLDMAIEASRDLPAELQDELARIMLTFVNEGQDVYVLTPEEEADLDEAEREVKRGEITTEGEVRLLLAKYKL